jgi:arginyl-tRNA synthetase
MIRRRLESVIDRTLQGIRDSKELELPHIPTVEIEKTRDKKFGDYSTNIAMLLAGGLKKNPMDIAEIFLSFMPSEPGFIKEVKAAPPGFINFYLSDDFLTSSLDEIEKQDESFGAAAETNGKSVQVEFVSANPTGPLHVGHGRWAAVGDTLANVLEAAGYQVEREFYINDYGNQMALFGASVSARYAQLLDVDEKVPEDGYQGEYIKDIAKVLLDKKGKVYFDMNPEFRRQAIQQEAKEQVIEHFRLVLESFGVRFDEWFSETSLHEGEEIGKAIQELRDHGHVFEKDGAVWLRTTDFGDDKDRVLIKESGEPTYFASDIAYHLDKFERGFDTVINVWGADHHGYVARMKAAIQALGYGSERLEIIIGQLVNLFRKGEPVRMSKRTGEMVTFDDLIAEVGPDVARYLFLTRSTDSPLDFDIELAKEQSQDNPVYYVQYAHARICSILNFAESKGVAIPGPGEADLKLLKEESELDLIRHMVWFPDFVEDCATFRAPFKLTKYAEDLAAAFHLFYTKCRVVTDDAALTSSRLALVKCARIVLRNTLGLLGVSAPESM